MGDMGRLARCGSSGPCYLQKKGGCVKSWKVVLHKDNIVYHPS